MRGSSGVEILPGFTCPFLGAGGECRGNGERSELVPVFDSTAHAQSPNPWTECMCVYAMNIENQLTCRTNPIANEIKK